jgi:hypothetical protein
MAKVRRRATGSRSFILRLRGKGWQGCQQKSKRIEIGWLQQIPLYHPVLIPSKPAKYPQADAVPGHYRIYLMKSHVTAVKTGRRIAPGRNSAHCRYRCCTEEETAPGEIAVKNRGTVFGTSRNWR